METTFLQMSPTLPVFGQQNPFFLFVALLKKAKMEFLHHPVSQKFQMFQPENVSNRIGFRIIEIGLKWRANANDIELQPFRLYTSTSNEMIHYSLHSTTHAAIQNFKCIYVLCKNGQNMTIVLSKLRSQCMWRVGCVRAGSIHLNKILHIHVGGRLGNE